MGWPLHGVSRSSVVPVCLLCSGPPFWYCVCVPFKKSGISGVIFLYFSDKHSAWVKHSLEIPILTNLQQYSHSSLPNGEWEYKWLFGKIVSMTFLDWSMKGALGKIQRPLPNLPFEWANFDFNHSWDIYEQSHWVQVIILSCAMSNTSKTAVKRRVGGSGEERTAKFSFVQNRWLFRSFLVSLELWNLPRQRP